MAKPILIIKLSYHITMKEYADLTEEVKSRLDNEYHILILKTSDENTDFQVFYEKDFNHVKYEELKKIVSKTLKKDINIKAPAKD